MDSILLSLVPAEKCIDGLSVKPTHNFTESSQDPNKSSLSASLTVFLIKFSLSFIFDTRSYLPIATIFSTDNLALLIVS